MKKLFFLSSIFLIISCGKHDEVKPMVNDIQELVFASGQLEWDDSYNLTAQSEGVLEAVTFDIGSKVEKGNSLAKINNSSSNINIVTASEQMKIANENISSNSPALLQLQSSIQFAETKYNQDKLMAERYQRLYEKQSVSLVENENMQLSVKSSLSNLNSLRKQYEQILQQAKQQNINAKSQLDNSKVVLDYSNVTASLGGTVIRKLKSVGDFVRKGDVIAVIANESKVKVILNVDENSIQKVKLGQEVIVKLNINKEQKLKAKVSKILAAFDIQTQSFICEVQLEEPLEKSIHGTQVEANIVIGKKKNVLLIPRNYIGYGNKVNIKGKGEVNNIKTGIVSSEYVEILDGLTIDDVLLPLKP